MITTNAISRVNLTILAQATCTTRASVFKTASKRLMMELHRKVPETSIAHNFTLRAFQFQGHGIRMRYGVYMKQSD